MWLLYLDDSGSEKNANDTHIILAGIAVPERIPYHISEKLEAIASNLSSEGSAELEFHASAMTSGRGAWRKIEKAERNKAFEDVLGVVSRSQHARLFAVAVHRKSYPDTPTLIAFEQIVNRFDRFLGRKNGVGSDQSKEKEKMNEKQLGVIIFDKSVYETDIQNAARSFRYDGHTWGKLKFLAEVPLFVDSRASRMVQVADLIAYSLKKYYINGSDYYIKRIKDKFDRKDNMLHGLKHLVRAEERCNCLACVPNWFHHPPTTAR